MVPTAPFADAVLVPVALRRGATQLERIRSVNRITDELLGVDYSKGEFSRIRPRPINAFHGKYLFVTKDIHDTYYHPARSPHRGKSRYAWVDQPGGVMRGFFTPEAKKENDARREGSA